MEGLLVSDQAKTALAKALADLRSGAEGLWTAVPALARIGCEADLTIDYAAEATLGIPLVIARPRLMVGGLTPRQQDVAALVACGLSNKQIARRSGITVGTVKDHVHAILRATGCRSRAELIVRVHGGQASVAQAAEPSI